MKIIIAIDSFKGCLSSTEANMAAAEGIRNVCPEAEIMQVPVSDGGEGFLEAFRAAIGGETVEIPVRDPMMRPITAEYLMQGETAVVEIARESGRTESAGGHKLRHGTVGCRCRSQRCQACPCGTWR